jgi:hypothetical protein
MGNNDTADGESSSTTTNIIVYLVWTQSLSGELSWWDDIIIYNDDKSDDEDLKGA